MVKLFALYILQHYKNNSELKEPVVLSGYHDTPTLAYFQKNNLFFSRLLTNKAEYGGIRCLVHDNFKGMVVKRTEGLTGVLISDLDYPRRVGFDCVQKSLEDFVTEYSDRLDFETFRKDFTLSKYNKTLKSLVTEYQNPYEVDEIYKAKKQLEKTKEIVEENLKKFFERGDTLESLMSKSKDLDDTAIQFYKINRKNKCCSIL